MGRTESELVTPQKPVDCPAGIDASRYADGGCCSIGRGRIRTFEGISHQIYSRAPEQSQPVSAAVVTGVASANESATASTFHVIPPPPWSRDYRGDWYAAGSVVIHVFPSSCGFGVSLHPAGSACGTVLGVFASASAAMDAARLEVVK